MNKTLDEHWSQYYRQGKDFVIASEQAVHLIANLTDQSPPKNCLDIGCGTGQLAQALNNRGFKVTAVDVSSEAVKLAIVKNNSAVTFIHFDIENEDPKRLQDQPFSLITCKLVYAFINNKPKFLSMVKSLLKDKGLFVIIAPLINNVPGFKKGIAVDAAATKKLLQKFFAAETKTVDELEYFICRIT